jgi:DivIVA domain-containing protein
MSLTPVEVRHLELRRGLFGYRRSSVEQAVDEVADSFEAVWRGLSPAPRSRSSLRRRQSTFLASIATSIRPL